MFFSLTLLLLTSTLVLARPDYSQLHHTRHFLEHRRPLQPTNGWSVVQAAPAEREIELSFALHTRNAGKLESTFWAVSDPQSKLYGKHLSLDQVTEMVAPHEETVADVRAWIEASGARIVRVPASRDWLIVRASVAQAEELLATEFHEFAHAQLDERVVRAMAPYSVPRELKGSVAFVSGVHTLPKVNAHRFHASPETASLAKRQTNPLIGPKQLRTRYNVTGVGAEAKNSMAVAEFQGQYYAPADLASFFKQYVDFAPPATVAGVRPAGSNNPNAPGVEASLDIEYIMGIAPNVTSYFYASASMDFWTSLDTWASLLAGEADCPLVHSISYGDQGGTSKPSKQYQERMNTEFQKLGARGISVIFASGDSGAGCEFCIYAEPSFPAVAPYVTSVGATRFINGVGSGEMAVESFGSGGGFAWDFSAPDYQKAAVDHYLTSNKAHLPYWFQYNTKGRGTPDVSALGIGFAVVVSGVTNEVGGTSASAPTFAAIVALLNDHRLAAKKTPLGFLNPWIYQTASKDPEAFYDVTKGTNSDGCCFTGFPAAAGWDASTGVGTPNFKQLLTHL